MSVINQMLKELDQRKTVNHSGSEAVMPMSSYMVPEKKLPLRPLIIVTILVIVSGLIFYGYRHLQIPVTLQVETIQQNTTTANIAQVEQAKAIISSADLEKTQNNDVIIFEEQQQPHTLITNKNSEQGTDLTEPAGVEQSVVAKIEKLTAGELRQIQVEDKAPDSSRVVKSKPQVDPETKARQLFEKAQTAIETGQALVALQFLNQALEVNPVFHQARVLKFSLLMTQQQLTILQQQLTTSLLQWPEVHEYRQIQARLLLQQNQANKALTLLQTDIPMVRQAPEYHALLAYIAQQTTNDQLASKHYQALLQQQPGRADWWLGLAVSSERLGNKKLALSAYQQSLGRPGLSQSVQAYARQRLKVIQGY